MFSQALFPILFASCSVAAPNALAFLARHEVHDIAAAVPAPVRRVVAFSPPEYGALPTVNATSVVTVTTTVTASPTAAEFSSITTTTSGSQPPISVFPEPESSSSTIASTTLHSQPAISVFPEPEPEEKAGVYICSDVSWGGKCEHKLSPLGSSEADCTQLDATASSIGPDVGFHCTFYTNAFCRSLLSDGSDTLELDYPGSSNLLDTKNGDFNDRINSYLCFKADPVEAEDDEDEDDDSSDSSDD